MSELPFLQAVLFPVDLRYGWNLLDKDHQQLLQRANKHFKPHTTTFELRSRNWHRISKRDLEADHRRQQETPMLQFVARHSIYLTEHQQNVIIEGPSRSIMWTCSPLQALKDRRDVHKTVDGLRLQRETSSRGLKSDADGMLP